MSATVDAPAAPTNSSEPVPLDTIPISPAVPNGANGTNAKENVDPKENGSAESNAEKDEQITILHNPNDFTYVHPLINEWTLWFTKPPSGKGDNWNDLLKEVVTFDTVEEFWGIYNNITPTSELALKSDYHLFKRGVRPEWEDPQNKHGGKWSYSFRGKAGPIDTLWLHVMLAAIGETLEGPDDHEVMGVVVNVRKGFYRIGLWTKSVGKGGEKAKDVLEDIGRKFKEVLMLEPRELVEFTGHTDSAHAGSTRAKAKLSV